MRIALVTETFPPEVNGVARTLWQLVSGLARRGHEVEVLRPDQKKREGELPAEGWTDVLMAGLPIPVYEGLRFGLPTRKLLKRWREVRPDVVHVCTEGPLGLSALWAARKLGIPVSTTFHTNFHDYGRFYGMGALRRIGVAYLRWFHNRAGCTLVPARDARKALEDDGFERVGILSRGVDTDLFRPDRRDAELRRMWGAGPNDLVVAFVSRLAEEKNPKLAAAAFAEVKRLVPSSRCVAVGDGPARGHMKELAPDLVFCGMRRGPDLAAHYASADLFLFPSLTETFGNVVLEGMASGLATATFDYAAAGMLVEHGVSGFKAPIVSRNGSSSKGASSNGSSVPATDDEAYLDMVREVACLPVGELREVGRRAAEVAREQTWDRIVGDFEGALRDLTHSAATLPNPSTSRTA